MITFLDKYESNKYSQNGEDGIIAECTRRLKLLTGVACEFGAADGYYCSNTRALADKGWNVMMYDINPGQSALNVMKAMITEDNINSLIPPCQVLSMDTDGPDYELWKAYKHKPDIVIIEINSGLEPMKDFYARDKGANYSAMVKMGIDKGYFLLCHTGNLIFVRNDHRRLFPEVEGDGLDNYTLFFQNKWIV